MKEPLISIIVPVYNVQKYIGKCIDSILSQTYLNIELILVDDGSSDASGRICDEYGKRDGRIRVIHQENEGVSSARNHGMEEAQGEYLCFVDADDWIPKYSVKQLATRIIASGSDLATGKIKLIFPLRNNDTAFSHYGTLSRDSELDWYKTVSTISPGPVAKIFKRSIIQEKKYLGV